MTRIAKAEDRLGTLDERIDKLVTTFEGLPRKALTWLLILAALVTICEFLGPSLRKTIGLASNEGPPVAEQHATIPSNP